MLIKLASGFEAVTRVRAHNLPTFARTVPFDHIGGTTLHPLLRALPAEEAGGQSKAPKATPAQTKLPKMPHHL